MKLTVIGGGGVRAPLFTASALARAEAVQVKSILGRSRSLAVQALMAHPLVMSYSRATGLLDEYLRAHAAYVGAWS